MKNGVEKALQKVLKQGRNVYVVFSICYMYAQWFYTLRYNIKGSVATLRAVPTPFFSASYKVWTKHLSYINNTVFLLLQSSRIAIMMMSDEIDFLCDVRITSIANVTLAERNQIVQSLTTHFTVIPAKVQLDQIIEWLQVRPFISILNQLCFLCIMVLALSAKLHNMLTPTVLLIITL